MAITSGWTHKRGYDIQFYQKAEANAEAEWRLLNGAVHPASKADFTQTQGTSWRNITLPCPAFCPQSDKVDLLNDKVVIRKTSPIVQPFTAQYVHCCQRRMGFSGSLFWYHWPFLSFICEIPPSTENGSQGDFELYKDVVALPHKFHDMLLGRYLELIPEDTTVIVISDPRLSSKYQPSWNHVWWPTAPAYEHGVFLFVMKGRELKTESVLE